MGLRGCRWSQELERAQRGRGDCARAEETIETATGMSVSRVSVFVQWSVGRCPSVSADCRADLRREASGAQARGLAETPSSCLSVGLGRMDKKDSPVFSLVFGN